MPCIQYQCVSCIKHVKHSNVPSDTAKIGLGNAGMGLPVLMRCANLSIQPLPPLPPDSRKDVGGGTYSKANDTKPKKNINIKPKLEPPSKNQPIVNEKGTSTHSKSCLSAEQCVNVSCTFSHPLTRPPLCPDGALCVSSLCLRLHPPQALEQRLLKKATHGLGGQFKAISAARKAHKNKLSAVTLQSFQLLQQAPEQVITKNIKT